MEGVFIKKTYDYKDIGFDYWVIKIDDKFWFMGPIAFALGYKDPTGAIFNIISPEEGKHVNNVKAKLPFGLKFDGSIAEDILISESGFYKLLSKSPLLRNEKWRISTNKFRYG
jgi:prophage antirepressor-like protein